METLSKKKLNESEKEYLEAISSSTNKAIRFISRGKVYLDIKKDGVALQGEKEDIDALAKLNKEIFDDGSKPAKRIMVADILRRFDWEMSLTKEGISGEGAIAIAFYSFLMGDSGDHNDILLRRISLGFKDKEKVVI